MLDEITMKTPDMLDPTMKCEAEQCGKILSWGEYTFSMNKFRKKLCVRHQKEERVKTYPPKLAAFINKNI